MAKGDPYYDQVLAFPGRSEGALVSELPEWQRRIMTRALAEPQALLVLNTPRSYVRTLLP